MKSRNFEILRSIWPELAALGGFAEAYTHTDPASALVKLRLFAENLTKDIYHDLGLPKQDQPAFVDLLTNQSFSAITPKVVPDKLHALRIHGNKAAHGEPATTRNALWLLQEAFDLARWLFIRFGKGDAKVIPAFQPPPTDDGAEFKREKRQVLEKLAGPEAQMDALLRDLEEARKAAATAEKRAEEIEALASSGATVANLLQFDEATTRVRIIDSLLATAGWNVALGHESTAQVGKEVEVLDQPTTTRLGYADYVLWDDNGNPLTPTGLEKMHGQRPVIFYTNGYDIWMWDDALNYPPRKVFGYYSKDSLQFS